MSNASKNRSANRSANKKSTVTDSPHATLSTTSTSTSTTAVVGLQYGDEGKGQIVDILSHKNDVIVRYNGGANAGHSVAIGNEKFVLHQIPIGTLTPNKQNILANGVVVSIDPLIEEMAVLEAAGIDLAGLRISDRAHVVMPYHLLEEKLRHQLTVKVMGEAYTLGTTFKGIGPCYADKAARDTAIRITDLYQEKSLTLRLELIVALKNAQLSALAQSLGEPFTAYTTEGLISQCLAWGRRLKPFVCDTSSLLNQAIEQGKQILFEGANAALLDVDHGTYPFVTSSNGSTLGISSGTGISPSRVGKKFGVAKAYMSRVGTGPFVTELHCEIADQLREAGTEYGSTTGRPRRIGWLDLPALKAMVVHNDINELVITGLAVLSSLDEFKVCTSYNYQGKQIETLPASVDVIEQLEANYISIKVTGSVQACQTVADLPDWANQLIALIEKEVGSVAAVCIGKRRDQALWF